MKKHISGIDLHNEKYSNHGMPRPYFLITPKEIPLFLRGMLEWTDETKTKVKFVEHENI